MNRERVSFTDLAWGAFYYRPLVQFDIAYREICKSGLPAQAVSEPERVTAEVVEEKLIRGFLQKWQMRIPGNEEKRIAEGLVGAFRKTAPILRKLHAYRLETVELTDSLKSEMEDAYCALRMSGLGPTGVSKVLHLLNPSLFVMWDVEMRKHYRECYGIGDEPVRYVQFLGLMHCLAQTIIEDAVHCGVNDPARFLSCRWQISPQYTLAKFIDEYNYTRFTRNVPIPPVWHPDKLNEES